tara:strand:+ start:14742 stop:15452 length:711 start_codon:yes stop_codon:yes gene_type:complete
MKKFAYTLLLAGLGLSTVFAQESNDSTASTTKADKYPMWKNRSAIGLSAGLPGFGIDYAYNINRSLNVRAGFLAFSFNDFNTDMDISGQSVNVNANLNSTVFDLMLEYHPTTNKAFKLVAGLSYLNNVGVNTLVLLNDDIGYGDLIINNEEIGDIDITLDYTGIAPYLGFGFGRAVPKKRAGFGIELGAYYAGGPDVTIVASGMLENTSEEEQQLEDNLASYAWIPRAMMRLTIKL